MATYEETILLQCKDQNEDVHLLYPITKAENVDGLYENATLTGVPTAPTAESGTNTTQVATTEFVQRAIGANAVTPSNFTKKSIVSLNLKSGAECIIHMDETYKECDLIVDLWKFVAGEHDVLDIVKVFDNACSDNFLTTDNVTFDKECKIKDVYSYSLHPTAIDKLYESDEIDLDTFLLIDNITDG